MLTFTVIGEVDLDAVEESLARQAVAAITPCTNPRPGHPGHWSQGHDMTRDVCTGCGIPLR